MRRYILKRVMGNVTIYRLYDNIHEGTPSIYLNELMENEERKPSRIIGQFGEVTNYEPLSLHHMKKIGYEVIHEFEGMLDENKFRESFPEEVI